jgi:hypothetical protein
LDVLIAPESPNESSHLTNRPQAIFYRLFRPEYLQLRKRAGLPPLSADALSNWGREGCEMHNPAVQSATIHLLQQVIPSLARDLDSRSVSALRVPVSEAVHRRGVNIRHIGLLRSYIRVNMEAKETLLIEVVSRALKNLLRQRLRHAMRSFARRSNNPNIGMEGFVGGGAGVASPSEYLIRLDVVDFLNLVSGSSPKSPDFWHILVRDAISERFGEIALSPIERSALFRHVRPVLFPVMQHTLLMLGIQVTVTCRAECEKDPHRFTFTTADLLPSGVKVKYLSLLEYAKAKVLAQQAYRTYASPAPHHALSDSLSIDSRIPSISILASGQSSIGTAPYLLSTPSAPPSPLAATSSSPSTTALVRLPSTPLSKYRGQSLNSRTALRLLSLSTTSYDNALRSNPLDESASRGAVIAQANTREILQDHTGADLLLISRVQHYSAQLMSALISSTIPSLISANLAPPPMPMGQGSGGRPPILLSAMLPPNALRLTSAPAPRMTAAPPPPIHSAVFAMESKGDALAAALSSPTSTSYDEPAPTSSITSGKAATDNEEGFTRLDLVHPFLKESVRLWRNRYESGLYSYLSGATSAEALLTVKTVLDFQWQAGHQRKRELAFEKRRRALATSTPSPPLMVRTTSFKDDNDAIARLLNDEKEMKRLATSSSTPRTTVGVSDEPAETSGLSTGETSMGVGDDELELCLSMDDLLARRAPIIIRACILLLQMHRSVTQRRPSTTNLHALLAHAPSITPMDQARAVAAATITSMSSSASPTPVISSGLVLHSPAKQQRQLPSVVSMGPGPSPSKRPSTPTSSSQSLSGTLESKAINTTTIAVTPPPPAKQTTPSSIKPIAGMIISGRGPTTAADDKLKSSIRALPLSEAAKKEAAATLVAVSAATTRPIIGSSTSAIISAAGKRAPTPSLTTPSVMSTSSSQSSTTTNGHQRRPSGNDTEMKGPTDESGTGEWNVDDIVASKGSALKACVRVMNSGAFDLKYWDEENHSRISNNSGTSTGSATTTPIIKPTPVPLISSSMDPMRLVPSVLTREASDVTSSSGISAGLPSLTPGQMAMQLIATQSRTQLTRVLYELGIHLPPDPSPSLIPAPTSSLMIPPSGGGTSTPTSSRSRSGSRDSPLPITVSSSTALLTSAMSKLETVHEVKLPSPELESERARLCRRAMGRAVELGDGDVVGVLHALGIDINLPVNAQGLVSAHRKRTIFLLVTSQTCCLLYFAQTPLMVAASLGHEDVLEVLLQSGAIVDLIDPSKKQTALMWACQYGREGAVAILLRHAASHSLKNKTNQTCLMLGSDCGHSGVVRLLLNANTNVDAQDSKGRVCDGLLTPFIVAIHTLIGLYVITECINGM